MENKSITKQKNCNKLFIIIKSILLAVLHGKIQWKQCCTSVGSQQVQENIEESCMDRSSVQRSYRITKEVIKQTTEKTGTKIKNNLDEIRRMTGKHQFRIKEDMCCVKASIMFKKKLKKNTRFVRIEQPNKCIKHLNILVDKSSIKFPTSSNFGSYVVYYVGRKRVSSTRQ